MILSLVLSCARGPVAGCDVSMTAVQSACSGRRTSCCIREHGRDESGYLTSEAAICVAETQAGLYETDLGRGAQFELRSGDDAVWMVRSTYHTTCEASGTLGGTEGCAVFLNARTGALEGTSSVSSTVTCY